MTIDSARRPGGAHRRVGARVRCRPRARRRGRPSPRRAVRGAAPRVPAEAKVVVTGTVNNLQVNQNALGVQITGDQLQQINEAIDKAPPGTLREVIKTWLPQAVNTGAGIATLLKALGIGG